MYISEVKLENWCNFGKESKTKLAPVSYVVGVNASGKSNLLDALRFLRDVANPIGGGFQYAIRERGEIKKIRCLHARASTDVTIEVTLAKNAATPAWQYKLSFNRQIAGSHLHIITQEVIRKYDNGKWTEILNEHPKGETKKLLGLPEACIKRNGQDERFFELVDFLGGITYVHLVPQLLKFANQIGGNRLEDDPFGQGLLEDIAKTSSKKRDTRLKKIEKALKGIVPNLNNLRFIRDKDSGHSHLEIRYQQKGAKQREDQFSDGTLRLIGLLWVLQEGGQSPLLLEEPELSLNEGIVEQIPLMIDRIMWAQKSDRRRQVIITTHSSSLLSNKSIGYDQITVIEPSKEGSTLRGVNKVEKVEMEAGLSSADAVLFSLKPKRNVWDF